MFGYLRHHLFEFGLELLELLLPGIGVDTLLYNVVAISATLTVAAMAYLFARIVIRPQIAAWVNRSSATWDNGLLKHGFSGACYTCCRHCVLP